MYYGFVDTRELIDERAQVIERVEQLETDLSHARERLGALEKVLSGLRDLGLLPSEEPVTDDPGVEHGPSNADAQVRRDSDERLESQSTFTYRGVKSRPPTTRIRSTSIVADLVNAAGKPLTREQVYEEFELTHGFPESWRNPRNALGNALTRAHDNGDIDRFGDMFAPKGYFKRVPGAW